MKILLLGKDGQVGRALGRVLPQLGEVTALGRAALDLADGAALQAALDVQSPKIIVNAAAHTDVEGAETAPGPAFAINGEAPGIMAGWAAGRGAALIHYSTDYVFDGRDGPMSERAPVNPLNIYGKSKLAGERAIVEAGCAHLILRTSWVYAAEGKNFLTTILGLAAEQEELRVVADQIGAPTPAGWLALATAQILGAVAIDPVALLGERGGIHHAACTGATDWCGFAEAILDGALRLGLPCRARRIVPINSAQLGAAAERPADSRLSKERLVRVWGIRPPDWRAALDETMKECVN
jgi:dTDP-4-dehydrorhamnose reductase